MDEGLGSNYVFKVVQDTNELIWLGTKNGIERYDGNHFKYYYLEPNRERINDLCIDMNENIWVGSNQGLYLYDSKKDRFIKIENKRLDNSPPHLIYPHSKQILVLITSKKIILYNIHTHKIQRVIEKQFEVHSITSYNKHQILLATDKGVYQMDIKNNIDLLMPLDSCKQIKNTICSYIFKDNNGRIWIASVEKGIYSYDLRQQKLTSHPNINNKIAPSSWVRKIIQQSTGDLLIGVDGSGVIALDTLGNVKDQYTHNEDIPMSINNNGIYDLMEDKQKRLWITTYGGGINLYDLNQNPFQIIKHQIREKNSLANNTAKSIFEDNIGQLWFGTKKGISIYQPCSKKWIHLNHKNRPLHISNNEILSITQISKDKVWIGSYGGGITEINIHTFSTRTPITSKTLKKNRATQYIFCIHKDLEQNVWIGSIRGMLICYSLKNQCIKTFPINSIKNIYQNDRKQLFLASGNGFYTLNLTTNDINHYTYKPNNHKQPNSPALSFYQASKNKIFIGTDGGGLNIFDPELQTFKYLTKKDGLPSLKIQCIIPEDSNKLWLSTTKGITCYNQREETFTNYDTSDGLISDAFNERAAYKLNNNEIIFGGNKGFIKFKPSHLKQNRRDINLIFTNLRIDNEICQRDQKHSPLKHNINTTKEITLAPNQNTFSLEFAGINFTNPTNTSYSWMLKGYDKHWHKRTTTNIASYTKVPPGIYSLLVKTSNIDHQWNSQTKTMIINILPYWWQTKIAYALYTVLLLFLIAIIINYYRIKIHEKSNQEKILFFTNIAHDIKTPLTLIKAPITALSKKNNITDDEKLLLDLSLKNTNKLISLFKQLLDFQKVTTFQEPLSVSHYNILEHIEQISQFFNPIIVEKGVDFQISHPKQQLYIWYDRNKMEQVFSNLLSNAFKYSHTNGKVVLEISEENNWSTIRLKDYGIGIPKKQQKYIFTRYYRASNAINSNISGSGIGLMLVKKIINTHHGIISFQSTINQGSTFTIKLPKGNKHFNGSSIFHDQNIELSSFQSTSKKIRDTLPSQKLLIVEDSKEIQVLLTSTLNESYDIDIANDGLEALQYIKEEEPDLIISDVMMPNMNGIELCSKLKGSIETCHIPIIILTALTSNEDEIESYKCGADSYIEKPFDIQILKSKISNLITSHQKLKEKFSSLNHKLKDIKQNNELDQIFMDKCSSIIHKHLDNPSFSVEILCKEIYMSRPVLYRKVKALTKYSPQDFIKRIRLNKAADLLCNSPLSISEIADQTGFSSPKYFSTAFRNVYKKTPSDYRNNH
ncbi:response regulator [Halosquirtibacter xylanolyticus]|uniref:hybrid sensor histidine kinase/response regulator transcription factor n=1 Tax=Halosquirtibacter xylanolyticus TaxID=3374599 RepID=UPI0037478860|nr:response regulator [Prolixibacteraceae bacterium]